VIRLALGSLLLVALGCTKQPTAPAAQAPAVPAEAAAPAPAPQPVPAPTPAPAPEPAAASAPSPAPSPAPAPAPATETEVWHRPGYEPPPIIDFHGHLSLAGIDRIRATMQAVGIDRIINLSGGSGRRGGLGWKYATVLSQRLQGRINNAMNVQWSGCCSQAWAEREVARLRFVVGRLGYTGLKISKALGLGARDERDKLVAVDDPRLDPLWRAAAEMHLPVSIHVADPKAFWEPLNDRNERWAELSVHPGWSYHGEPVPSWTELLDAAERMFARHPKTTFVAVHFGNAGEDIERVDRMLRRLKNVHIDIAARVPEFGRHPPARVRRFFVEHQDRVLFGTDIGISDDYLMLGSNGAVPPREADILPFYNAHFRYLEGDGKQIAHPSPIQGDWKIDAINLPAQVLGKLYRDNALRLLARVRPPAKPADKAEKPAAGKGARKKTPSPQKAAPRR